jgi:SNF2 family DNA or RNA helicase
MRRAPKMILIGSSSGIRCASRTLIASCLRKGARAFDEARIVGSKGTPALVLVPPHLQSQWRDEIKKFLPAANVCLMRSVKKGRAPPAGIDFYGMSFHVAAKLTEDFTKRNPIRTLVMRSTACAIGTGEVPGDRSSG